MINHIFKTGNLVRTAIITETGRVVTYSALLNDITSVASQLKDRDLIFIICHNDYAPLQFYLAALETGVVPLILSADIAP